MPRTLNCSQCKTPMYKLSLEGHYGNVVLVDVCERCHWVWFDRFESVRLSGLGWVAMLRHMLKLPAATQTQSAAPSCVHCGKTLNATRNLTRFGRSAAYECVGGHGQFQGFSMLLAERGLVRPMTAKDHGLLTESSGALACMNCGSTAKTALHSPANTYLHTPECEHCQSPYVLFDLPRLTKALTFRHARAIAVTDMPEASRLALACTGCGSPLNPSIDLRCEQCDQPVALPTVQAIKPLLDQLEPILKGSKPKQAAAWGSRWGERRKDAWGSQFGRLISRWLHPEATQISSGVATLLSYAAMGLVLWLGLRACIA
jgi:Transcription factor zinc-finger